MTDAWFVVLDTLIALVIGFTLGRAWNRILLEIWQLKQSLNHKSEDKTEEPPKSMMVEPLTPEQQAAKDMQERIKRVNG